MCAFMWCVHACVQYTVSDMLCSIASECTVHFYLPFLLRCMHMYIHTCMLLHVGHIHCFFVSLVNRSSTSAVSPEQARQRTRRRSSSTLLTLPPILPTRLETEGHWRTRSSRPTPCWKRSEMPRPSEMTTPLRFVSFTPHA